MNSNNSVGRFIVYKNTALVYFQLVAGQVRVLVVCGIWENIHLSGNSDCGGGKDDILNDFFFLLGGNTVWETYTIKCGDVSENMKL